MPDTEFEDNGDDSNGTSRMNASELLAFIERRERLAEEAADIKDQVSELNTEIKSSGYDLKHVNHLIKARAMDPDKRANENAEREMYEEAVGLV